MQPTRLDRLRAQAEHLLDLFVGLREKYALVDPMIFDELVAHAWGNGRRARGYEVLRYTLFNSCVLDLCKISVDPDDRSPSVEKFAAALDDEQLRDQLREMAAQLQIVPRDGIPADVHQLLQLAEQRDEEDRRRTFDTEVEEFRAAWRAFNQSPALSACVTLRDKLVAHSELHHDGERYKRLDVAHLGLQWGDLKALLQRLQMLVELVGHLFRQSSFAWDMLDEQLAAVIGPFWQLHRDA